MTGMGAMAMAEMVLMLLFANPGDDTLAIFQSKCASCHSPQAKKVKGNFNFVLDLKKLAADPEKIVPGDPCNSDLWKLVSSGNMPPNDSPTGQLSEQQKQSVRAWVVAGAPPPLSVADSQTPRDSVPVDSQEPSPDPPDVAPPIVLSWWQRSLILFGKFHLLLLHFPIALVFVALGLEAYRCCRPAFVSLWGISDCLWASAASSIPVIALGWIHSISYGHGTDLFYHRWLGTFAGALMALAALLAHRDSQKGHRSLLTLLGLIVAALVTGLAAHFGGSMVHGDGFLNW